MNINTHNMNIVTLKEKLIIWYLKRVTTYINDIICNSDHLLIDVNVNNTIITFKLTFNDIWNIDVSDESKTKQEAQLFIDALIEINNYSCTEITEFLEFIDKIFDKEFD